MAKLTRDQRIRVMELAVQKGASIEANLEDCYKKMVDLIQNYKPGDKETDVIPGIKDES